MGRIDKEGSLLGGVEELLGGGGHEVPGQEFFDAVDWMIGDAGQHVAEVGFGIKSVQVRGADQAVNCGGALAAGIGAGEQVVLSVMKAFS